MPRLNTRQQFERTKCLATPEESKIIDEYARWVGFGPRSRYKLSKRNTERGVLFLDVLCHQGNGFMIGVMALDVAWVKKRVKQEKERRRRELARQAVLETGAYI